MNNCESRMFKKLNAQFAIEFVVLIAFMFLIFLGFTAVITSKILEAKENERQRIAEDLATLAKNEIELAKSVSDGYSRTFTLPAKFDGNSYDITIIDNKELVVNYLDKEYVVFLPENFDGYIGTGINLIQKIDGVVILKHIVACNDNVDNDDDGLIDLSDPGCSDETDTSEYGANECDDGIDNGDTDIAVLQ